MKLLNNCGDKGRVFYKNMEYIGIIITGFVGLITSIVTWFLGKRKYNSEVDNTLIQNMQQSLEFYKSISDDYKVRLASEIKSHNQEVAELRAENSELKKELREQEKRFDEKLTAQQREITLMKNQMLSVYSQVCLNFNCIERAPMQRLNEKKAKKTPKKIDKEVISDTSEK